MKNTGKRIDLIANRKPQSQRVLYELRDRLKRNQFILNDTNPDIVISIGGDGMLLSAFHKYENQLDKVRFIGVHTGHLGFYTDYRDFELDKLVTNLQLDTGARVSYPVLNVKVFSWKWRGQDFSRPQRSQHSQIRSNHGGRYCHQ